MIFFSRRGSDDRCDAISAVVASRSRSWLIEPRRLFRVVRAFVFFIWPMQAIFELLVSVLHVSEEEQSAPASEQQAIEAFVDAATEEGIIEQDEARLIEQVVEFGDKRVREVMTPRPDVIAIRGSASLEELRELVVGSGILSLARVSRNRSDDGDWHRHGARHVGGAGSAKPRAELCVKLMRPALFSNH